MNGSFVSVLRMLITQHALKRLAILTGDYQARQELLFMHQVLLPGAYSIKWEHGLQVDDIPKFAARCHAFRGRMLGLETWFESPYPLYTFTFEDYSDKYTFDWYKQAIDELKSIKILDMVIPTVDFPERILKNYF